MRAFTLICLLIASPGSLADDQPTDIFDGEVGALTAADYHESGVNLPVDWEELCLTHGAEYEVVATSRQLPLLLYVQDASEPVSRSRAWASVRGREIADLESATPYHKATLRFRVPPGTTWCHEVFVVTSVQAADGEVYGAYHIEMSPH